MTHTELTLKKVMQKYNKAGIIKESKIAQKKKALIQEAKAVKEEKLFEEKKEQKEEAKVEEKTYANLDENEKEFIDAFIEYNELSLLNESNEELIKCFTKSLGDNAKPAIEELQNKSKERDIRIKELAKKLSEIKDQIIKETEKARSKESLVSLFNSAVIVPEPPKKEVADKAKTKAVSKDLVMPDNIVENKKK